MLRKYKYNIGRRKENILRIRVDDEMLKRIKSLSRKKGLSMSKMIRRAIVSYIAKDIT